MSVAEAGAGGRGAAAHNVARAAVVAGWLVEGCSAGEVHQRAREAWGVSHRTADRLVAAGRGELIREWADVDRKMMLALLLARLDTVFREAMAARNHGAALGAINAAAKLAKL